MTSAREAPPIRIGLATCAALPNGDGDEALLAAALNDRGVDTEWVVWSASDPAAMGERFDAVVIRSTWDYVDDREAFIAWVEACAAPIWNPAPVVRWNSDKRYMLHLLAGCSHRLRRSWQHSTKTGRCRRAVRQS